MAEFETPVFLQNHSPEEVFAHMKQILPSDLDLSEGGHAYNLTMPTALVIGELCEFILPEIIKLIFPEWSYGEFLDYHAQGRGMTRRAASAASGELTITGEPKTVIPAGSMFSTAAVNDEPSVDYKTLEAATIPDSGTVTVAVMCNQTGIIGNTDPGTIVLVSGRLTGVMSVTNEKPVSGGTEVEDDESLIERIVEYDKSQGESYTGSLADYKRWATSVAGVGSATVIPAQDDSGLITIILTDANGAPATEQLCTSVYNYIMRPDSPYERLAPVNALIKVEAPATFKLSISAIVELEEGATFESVKNAYAASLAVYLAEALADGEIKYSRLCAILAATEGVYDFSDLMYGLTGDDSIYFGHENYPLTTSQLPTVHPEDLGLIPGSVPDAFIPVSPPVTPPAVE